MGSRPEKIRPIRSFIALEIPDYVKEEIARIQGRMKKNGVNMRWVKPDNIHLTLKFLGDVAPDLVEKISLALARAVEGHGRFSLSAKGMGVFPGIKNPRVVWVGLAGGISALAGLHRSLESALEPLGFPVEKRRFSAHLTMGRARDRMDGEKLNQALLKEAEIETRPFDCRQLILFKSDLLPAGPVYTRLAAAPLAG